MSRIKTTKQLLGEEVLDISPENKRFATPEVVARYRAERLACDTISDLCSGFGFQSFAFAKTCKQVIAVERNPDTVGQARKYAEKLGIKNITFICGDVLAPDVYRKIALLEPNAIFCDPERVPAEKERTIETIQPHIKELLELYGKITPNIALELPPHISNTAFDAEYEYLSLDGALNRLTLYFGNLKKAQKSVVLLPENIRIAVGGPFLAVPFPTTDTTEGYTHLLEPNPALVLSGLFKEGFAFSLGAAEQQITAREIIQMTAGKKIFFLSTKKIDNPFFTSYHILERLPFDKNKIALQLQKCGAGKVVLRYTLEPKEYWKERTFFEKQLKNGEKTIHLFVFDKALLCEKMAKD